MITEILGVPPPTPEQARIIAHPLAPLLVVAGAGSGSTIVVTTGDVAVTNGQSLYTH